MVLGVDVGGAVDDAVSATQDTVDAATDPSNAVGAVPVFGSALSSVATAGETVDGDYENPIGKFLDDSAEDAYSSVNYWGAGGLLPGDSDATGGDVGNFIDDQFLDNAVTDTVTDVVPGAGGDGGNGGNGSQNGDGDGSGLPSWAIPAAIIAAAIAYLVAGGEI